MEMKWEWDGIGLEMEWKWNEDGNRKNVCYRIEEKWNEMKLKAK